MLCLVVAPVGNYVAGALLVVDVVIRFGPVVLGWMCRVGFGGS